ncbi:MAG: AmmeMemoRadiSam system protein B [Candidatus Abyssobacteria bacterium SURF_5]|uniref:MEMO1 family protein C4520_14855 n=1 Tax=Abyssobacteria bacterium (strain SURF_5) TaxID=2093360 RepID=A0A3A4NAN7_ABYX5|nr:MAG: AmmeMemoRadiSam system protein B [Candidatus Abyssubacteria bacterium SURF_5]
MRKYYIVILWTAILLFAFCCGENQPRAENAPLPQALEKIPREASSIIPPSVAGAFYPADAARLKADIASCVESAEIPEMEGEIVAAIVPHAGYAYSAPVAAYAYKAIAARLERQKSEKPEAIFILAFSHRISYPHISVLPRGAMETPLGHAQVHETSAAEFIKSSPLFSFAKQLFIGEHSAEVQLPFLQVLLPDAPIVPVIFGQQSGANIQAVVDGLEKAAKSHRILVIATTDLSHYNPYETANALDKETIDVMLEGNPRRAAAFLSEHYDRMCGRAPVVAALSFAESQNAVPVLLKYANSGDTAGRKDAVVGYAALVFVKKHDAPPAAAPETADQVSHDEYLTEDEKNILLRIARNSVETYVREKKQYSLEVPSSERLQEKGAAFVTLTKNGSLRGCIGQMQATLPLYQTVAQMAVAAASQDPRFPPVRPDELDSIHIEISVNTPLAPVAGPEEIILGKHGVVVAKGLRQGVFLPQVATETGWTKEEFLRNLCVQKAGLWPDSYLNGARLFVFTSIVFEEKK